jgi:catechol 2,3-dioxygenase-like lactoylglutathione lyase family enzyme
MKKKVIGGIQQIGVGVPEIYAAWSWYKRYFGYDVRIFEEAAVAELMLPYTNNQPRERHAALALNLQGGGGFEIWQHTQHKSTGPKFDIKAGDLGIYITKIKTRDAQKAYDFFKKENQNIISGIVRDPSNQRHFFIKDPYENIFQIIEGDHSWFSDNKNKVTGGTYGAIIGVSDIDKALKLYSDILGYDQVIYDQQSSFKDFSDLPGGSDEFRRVLLTHKGHRKGPFAPVFGDSHIELIEIKNRTPEKIFKDRMWGELGFIHLCFDIQGMDVLREECKEKGFSFTVDTGDSFDMGEAAGAFSYIEDPDGTLIEFVETHKIPVMKKFGWYYDLRKRDPEQALPRWMLKLLGLSKAKDI